LSATPLLLFTCNGLAIMFCLEHAETQEITVKILKIVKHTARFASPCNINNFDGVENGGG